MQIDPYPEIRSILTTTLSFLKELLGTFWPTYRTKLIAALATRIQPDRDYTTSWAALDRYALESALAGKFDATIIHNYVANWIGGFNHHTTWIDGRDHLSPHTTFLLKLPVFDLPSDHDVELEVVYIMTYNLGLNEIERVDYDTVAEFARVREVMELLRDDELADSMGSMLLGRGTLSEDKLGDLDELMRGMGLGGE